MENKKVLLGMSGGVDSSVSAILLQKQGYEVIGCTMVLWEPSEEESESQVVKDAQKVCAQLGIQHITMNGKPAFKQRVIEPFMEEYKNARTPNPCVECNQYLKFGAFYQKAQELGCDYIATGHYASVEFSEKYQQFVLRKSEEEKKDQSYFLYTIPKEKLEHIIFPLHKYTSKEEIRKLAEQYGLEIAQKKDSQEICFIPDGNYQCFLERYSNIKKEKGNIVLKNKQVLGQHQGLTNYTIGQRKGLGISYEQPLYVVALKKETNEVVVGTEKDLYRKELTAKKVNWIVGNNLKESIKCKAKIRYRAKEASAIVYLEPGKDQVKVVFDHEQRAITPGQSVVFYDDDGIVLGGGIIEG